MVEESVCVLIFRGSPKYKVTRIRERHITSQSLKVLIKIIIFIPSSEFPFGECAPQT